MSGQLEIGPEPFDRYYASITAIADSQLEYSRTLAENHSRTLAEWMMTPGQLALSELLDQTRQQLEVNLISVSTSAETCMSMLQTIEGGLSQTVQNAATAIRLHMDYCGGAAYVTEPPVRRMQAALSDVEKSQVNVILDHYKWNEIVTLETTKGRSPRLTRQLGGLSTTEVARAAHAVLDTHVWRRVIEAADTSSLGVASHNVTFALRDASTPESRQAMLVGLDALCYDQVQDAVHIEADAGTLKGDVSELLRNASSAVVRDAMISQILTTENIEREYRLQMSHGWIDSATSLESFTANMRDHFDTQKHPGDWTSRREEFEGMAFDRLTETD